MEHPEFFRLFQFAATDARFTDGLRRGEKVAVNEVAKHVADAIEAGEIADQDPLLLAHAMLGVHTHLVHLVHRGLMEPTEELIDTAVSFSLHGLGSPAATS